MTNPHRGEAEFELDGKRYVVRIDFNAMAEIQNDTGISLMDRSQAESKGFVFIRSALAAGLSHNGVHVTPQQAGNLIGSHMSKLVTITQAVSKAINLFLVGPNPPKQQETEASDDDRPTTAAAKAESQATA